MKYYFKVAGNAYEFQRRLKDVDVESELVNELTRGDVSIKLTSGTVDQDKADQVFGIMVASGESK